MEINRRHSFQSNLHTESLWISQDHTSVQQEQLIQHVPVTTLLHWASLLTLNRTHANTASETSVLGTQEGTKAGQREEWKIKQMKSFQWWQKTPCISVQSTSTLPYIKRSSAQKLFDHNDNFDGSTFPHPDVLRKCFFLEWFNSPPGKGSQQPRMAELKPASGTLWLT